MRICASMSPLQCGAILWRFHLGCRMLLSSGSTAFLSALALAIEMRNDIPIDQLPVPLRAKYEVTRWSGNPAPTMATVGPTTPPPYVPPAAPSVVSALTAPTRARSTTARNNALWIISIRNIMDEIALRPGFSLTGALRAARL